MKTTAIIIALIFIPVALWFTLTNIAQAQSPTPRPVVDARPRRNQVLAMTGGVRPEAAELAAQATPPQTATWSAYNHYTFSDYNVTFDLRYTSTHAYYYVDQGETVSAGTLAAIAAFFDANYITVRDDFGSIPDVDGEPRVFILLTDIQDEYAYTVGGTAYVPCFFDPLHEHPAQPNSNGREMLFLDVDPTTPNSGEAGRCLTHQLALMAAYNYDPTEEYWADEGMASLAEFIAGYGHRPEVEAYLQNPDQPLTGWSGSNGDIGQSYLWSLYIRERFGQSGAKQLFQSNLHGLTAISPTLAISEDDLFHQWTVANYLDDPVQGGGIYDYTELSIVSSGADGVDSFTRPPIYETVSLAANETKTITGTLSGYYAARYIAVKRTGGAELRITDSSLSDFGQSTLINGQVDYPNWVSKIEHTTFAPGDTALLVVGLSRNSGSTDYIYNLSHVEEYIYWFPLIFK